MTKKPYEVLLERVKESDITPNNKAGLIEFLENEHPGDVLFTKWTNPPIIENAKGNKVYDVDGKEYIDCIAGMSAMNIGHCDPRIAETMKDQYLNSLDNWFDFPTPQRLKLVQRLIDITPGDYRKKVRLALSGSDAVENAIRLARYHTKKQTIVCFYGGYHGQSTATMGLTGAGSMHRWYNPMPSADHNIERFPYPYCYRCPYGREEGSCNMECVKAIDNLMASGQTSMGNPMSGVQNVAAMIVEPCQSSAGYIVPPTEFLAELRKLADKYGFLLIFDEIQTGMGRTGKMFACEHSGVAPDLLLIGKALGAGVPMSAVVGRAEIFEDCGPGFICSTYAGYSLGCAVANKVLDIFEEDQLVERCAAAGRYVEEKLAALIEKHTLVGSYSIRGIFFGVEFVKDRDAKEPAIKETAELVDNMKDAGLLAQLNGYYNNRISFIPPINVSDSDVDDIFDIFDAEITKIEEKFGYK
ncbi:aspartate aminotransferase family protein [Ruminococcus sp. OA3]|uniref:aspartate aminotransferase family protein n=1 Tax=Ruminococcus sp. OA3 TaxID=2914164 RepID=UPI001F05938E|nr:aspartate aminotransferase family protein [Ruminococcus sp. OA3]MCH1981706.1 aspartate aminotransferase family protein [Ruminococcus sp. OA3]